jgi:hypothetical protein
MICWLREGGESLEGMCGEVTGTYILSMLARVWSSFSILNVAALGIFVSGVIVSLCHGRRKKTHVRKWVYMGDIENW